MPKPKRLPPGKKYPLRVLQRRFEILQPITFLIPVFSYFLWWIAPDVGLLAWGRDYLIMIAILALLFFIASVAAPSFCYVQCYDNYLFISSPLYRFNISYARLSSTTPVNFNTQYPLTKQKELEQMMLSPLYREQNSSELTVVGVSVKKFPLPLNWLKFWFGKYIFMPRNPGFLFITPNWSSLSREIDLYRHEWRERRMHKEAKGSAASQILSKKDMKYDR
jgi:hypothetical protein